MLKYIKIGGRKLGLICAVQKQQEGISVLSFVQKTLFLSLSRVFSPHDLNGSRIKKANLKFFIFVVVVVVVAIFSAGCT